MIQPVITGTNQGALNNRDGLPQLHHAGVHKAHNHDRGSGGGLDNGSNAVPRSTPFIGVPDSR